MARNDVSVATYLELPDDNIENIDWTKYPCLETLVLGENNLREFPLIPSLTLLDLGSNNIDHIPAGIHALTNLQILDLGTNKIRSVPIMTNLQRLQLGNNPISEFDGRGMKLVELGTRHVNLTSLRLDRVAHLTVGGDAVLSGVEHVDADVLIMDRHIGGGIATLRNKPMLWMPRVHTCDIRVLQKFDHIRINDLCDVTTCIDIGLPQFIDLFCEK